MSGPFVLITGVLFKNSESKIAKSGKPYATANVIVTAGNERTYWRITAFGETAQAELQKRVNQRPATANTKALMRRCPSMTKFRFEVAQR